MGKGIYYAKTITHGKQIEKEASEEDYKKDEKEASEECYKASHAVISQPLPLVKIYIYPSKWMGKADPYTVIPGILSKASHRVYGSDLQAKDLRFDILHSLKLKESDLTLKGSPWKKLKHKKHLFP